jgi:hypothetical protein
MKREKKELKKCSKPAVESKNELLESKNEEVKKKT